MTPKQKVELIWKKHCRCDICGRYIEEPVDQGPHWTGKKPPVVRRYMDVVKEKVVCSDCVPEIIPPERPKKRKNYRDPKQMRLV